MKELFKGIWGGIKSLLFYAIIAVCAIGGIWLFWELIVAVFETLIHWIFG